MARVLIDGMSREFGGAVAGLAFEVGHSQALDKASVRYEATPHEGQRCASCWHFVSEAGDADRCQIVQGTIEQDGWCAVWAGKA